MTAEHLLEAMGLLDDDLIQEAENVPAHKPANWRRWGTLAACAVLAVALGYGVTHLPAADNSSGSTVASSGIAESNTTSSMGTDAADGSLNGADSWDIAPPTTEPGASVENGDPQTGRVLIYMGENVYTLYDAVEELPEGCELLGTLSGLDPDAPHPATDGEDYIGCQLWAPDKESPAELYVQLPGGGYAVAHLTEP